MVRSLNRVSLIGNLTRDPELRYTPQGTAVCTFGVATNRQWKTDAGEKKEDAEFHRIVAWNKLAEICAQFLKKGRKTFVEGRLQTRSWTGDDNVKRTQTENVASDMILLDSRGATQSRGDDFNVPDDIKVVDVDEPEKEVKKPEEEKPEVKKTAEPKKETKPKQTPKKTTEEIDDEIPF